VLAGNSTKKNGIRADVSGTNKVALSGIIHNGAGGNAIQGVTFNAASVGGFFTSQSSSADSHGLHAWGTGGYGIVARSTSNTAIKVTTGTLALDSVDTDDGLHVVGADGYGAFLSGQNNLGVWAISATSKAIVCSGTTRGCEASGGSTGWDFYAAGGNGSTQYGPFTGAHDALTVEAEIEPGDILVIDSVPIKRGMSDYMCVVSTSTTAEHKNPFGVAVWLTDLPYFSNIDRNVRRSSMNQNKNKQNDSAHDDRPAAMREMGENQYKSYRADYKMVGANALGEGMINVCSEGGDIEAGDWICTSNVRGKGKAYHGADSRVIVAKAAEAVIWANEPETTKLIACKYKTD
jgi:hypothetical protein